MQALFKIIKQNTSDLTFDIDCQECIGEQWDAIKSEETFGS
jgi:hypothetical protein